MLHTYDKCASFPVKSGGQANKIISLKTAFKSASIAIDLFSNFLHTFSNFILSHLMLVPMIRFLSFFQNRAYRVGCSCFSRKLFILGLDL